MAEGLGRVVVPVQWGCLVPRISTPSPQSQGSNRPNPGRTPASPGKATEVASSWVVALIRVGTASSWPSRRRSRSGPCRPGGGRRSVRQDGGAHGQWAEDPVGHINGERHARTLGQVGGQPLEAGIGVDPPSTGSAERRAASGPRPDAWASRCLTVEPGGPTGSSRSRVPSSTATRTARAVTGLVTDAHG